MSLSVKHLRNLFGDKIPTAQVLQGVASGMADCGVKVLIDPSIKVPMADSANKRIMLPSSVKSARALLIVSWYVDHESGHIIYTPPLKIYFKKWLRDSKMKDICVKRGYGGLPDKILEAAKFFHNFCEDARIERLMIGRFPGSKKHFIGGPIAAECDDLVVATVRRAKEKAAEEGLKEAPLNPFWVGELHAYHILGGAHGQQELDHVRETVPEHVHWVCDVVDDVFKGIHDVTQVTCQELADRTDEAMARILEEILPDQTQEDPGQPQKGEEGQEGQSGEGDPQQGDGNPSQDPFEDKMEGGKGKPQKSKYQDLRDEAEEEGGGDGEGESEGDGSEGDDGSDDHSGSEDDDSSSETDGGSASDGDSGDGDEERGDDDGAGDSPGGSSEKPDEDGSGDGSPGGASGDPDKEGDEQSEGSHGGSSGDGSPDDDGELEGESEGDSGDGDESGEGDDAGEGGEGDDEGEGGEDSGSGDDAGSEEDPSEVKEQEATPEEGDAPISERINQVMDWADDAKVDMSSIMSEASEFQQGQEDDPQDSAGQRPGSTGQGGGSPSMKHATDIDGMPDEYLERMAPGCGVTVISDLDLGALFNEKDPVFDAYDNFTRSLMPKTLGPAARRLVGKFQGAAGPAWSGNRINPRMLQPIMAGKAHGRRLYLKRTDPVQSRRGVCVAIAIDCSGSMCGHIPGLNFQPGNQDKQTKFVIAHAAARSLARLFQTIGVPFAVTGFTTKDVTSDGSGSRYSWNSNYSRSFDIVNFVFKNFDEPWTCCEQRMLAMNQFTSIRYKGEEISPYTNSDGESILWLASDMIGREEDRKVMIVLSDGLPYAGDSHMQSKFLRWAVRRIEMSGIRIGGLGLGDRGVASYYKVHELIDSFPAGYGTEATAPLYIQEKILSLIDRLSD